MAEQQGMPMIQEFIPGGQKPNYYLLLDKKSKLKVGFCDRRLRFCLRVTLNLATAQESTVPHPYFMNATRLVQKLGWWGGTTVQTKIDPRDGIPKLMEINPRMGGRLWERTELGINEPLMCLKIAKGEEVEAVKEYPLGTILLDPVEDLLGLGFKLLDLLVYKLRIKVLGKVPIDPLNPPMALKEIFQSYKETYLNNKEKVFNPYFRYFFQDPLVSIWWWLQFFNLVLKARIQLGR